ncbi:MAG: hypothetical protein IPJ61_19790 [Tessaracoccus sp.]|uniref:hypothetical protein n=1 Tax=Tessaracoccus sp. TaxID=1971211 RepID=UPI001ED3DA0D|nr:hypothetical protein [Tessaracoccus sp.]MBK7823230.1 hypothetical protein [Tessaracoccus sp.]
MINTRTIWYHGGNRVTDWRDYHWDRDRTTSDAILRNYVGASTKADAAIQLYHDLFRHDDAAYVAAMHAVGFDGFIVPRRQAGSRQRDHLILWNIAAVELGEVAIPDEG